MKQNARIPGIDNFKLAAAFLVIMIHAPECRHDL